MTETQAQTLIDLTALQVGLRLGIAPHKLADPAGRVAAVNDALAASAGVAASAAKRHADNAAAAVVIREQETARLRTIAVALGMNAGNAGRAKLATLRTFIATKRAEAKAAAASATVPDSGK